MKRKRHNIWEGKIYDAGVGTGLYLLALFPVTGRMYMYAILVFFMYVECRFFM